MRSFTALYIFFVLLLSINICAQVPNNSFEQWTDGNPDGWSTNNFIVSTNPVTQSTDAHTGSYAVRGEVVATNTGFLQPLILTGIIGGHGTPISQRYTSLTGYYKFHAVTNENISIVLSPFRNDSIMGVGGSQFFAATEYTKFTVPIFYSKEGTPDSCQISITIGNNSGATNIGSYFVIDDLSYELTTDVNETSDVLPTGFSLEQNYPNPFNPSTKIKYTIALPNLPQGEASVGTSFMKFVNLTVYDILGNKVATLVNEEKPAGSYEVEFNVSGLASGMYLYKLQAGDFTETRKMILMK